MSKHLRLLTVVGIVAVLSLAPTIPVIGQRLGQRSEATFPVIVVFNDNAGFQRFSGRYLPDDRAGANPAGWDYLDFGVAGAVQALEASHGFRATHVYSAAVRGFAARLTARQIANLENDSTVA